MELPGTYRRAACKAFQAFANGFRAMRSGNYRRQVYWTSVGIRWSKRMTIEGVRMIGSPIPSLPLELPCP